MTQQQRDELAFATAVAVQQLMAHHHGSHQFKTSFNEADYRLAQRRLDAAIEAAK
jgi:hypothetical protein